MWIIPFFVCLSVILTSNAEELTTSATQTVTETPNDNIGVSWDTTSPPVTLSIRDGRSGNSNRPANENSVHPLFYSNQWKPILMPIGFSINEDHKSHETENDYSMDHQFVPTFLRRPDSETNKTVPSNLFAQPVERNEFSSVPIHLPQIFYYPSHFNSYSNADSHEVNTDKEQNSSAPVLKPVISHSVTSSSEETYSETLPAGNFRVIPEHFQFSDIHGNPQGIIPPFVPGFYPTQSNLFWNGNSQRINEDHKQISSTLISKPIISDSTMSSAKERSDSLSAEKSSLTRERFQPAPFYGNTQGFIPPMAPAYFPSYPFQPFAPTLQPMIPYQTNDPNFDREAGSGVLDNVQDVPERRVFSGDVHDQLAENTPSETSASIVPPHPLPLPIAGFPFGVLPPPFIPPFIPNSPRSLELNPSSLSQSTNVQREDIITDPVPPPPTIPATLPLESTPDVLPPVDYLAQQPEAGLLSDSEVSPEVVVPIENSNSSNIPYEFGFQMNDGKGTDQHRKEVSDASGVVTGSYGYRDVFGVYRMVNYIADKHGFRAFIKSNEPGVASSGSADVVVMAERPPQRAIAEGIKVPETEAVVVPGVTTDLLTAGSNTESE